MSLDYLGDVKEQRVKNKLISKLLGIEVVTTIIRSRLRWFKHIISKDKHSCVG